MRLSGSSSAMVVRNSHSQSNEGGARPTNGGYRQEQHDQEEEGASRNQEDAMGDLQTATKRRPIAGLSAFVTVISVIQK
jgi:hypothetical protein